MSQAQMLFPCVGMAALTAIVWVRLYVERIGEMRERRIHPQALAASEQVRATLKRVAASDNFRNLFEMPVLFYALCLAVAAGGLVTPAFAAAAWAYVGLRALHSFIHITYNKVLHRFYAYAASSLWLFGLWGVLGVKLLARP